MILSIAIPAFRERARLPTLLARLVDLAEASPRPATEFLVVDDGSPATDVEVERAAAMEANGRLERARLPHRARFLALPSNGGKGAAIRAGWADADPTAAWLGFVDADGAVGADEIWRLAGLAAAEPAADVVAAARIRMAGRRIERNLIRHLQGRVFATFVERLFRLGFYDTQCGAKFFRASRLRPVLPHLREDRWLLDVEVIALLLREGAVCVEEPIDWCDPGGSKLVPGLDPLRMAIGLWRMSRRLAREAERSAR